jgi:hypothetical protein
MNDDEISKSALDVEGQDVSDDMRPQRTHAELRGVVDGWYVRISAMVDEAANNRARMEYEAVRAG